MPRAPLNESAVESFRARASAAATRLFAERGYDGVSVRAVAAALGVSPMTPYRYFENKDALFARVRADAFRRFADAQRDALREARGAADDPRAALARLEAAYVRFALREPDAYRVMFELRQAPRGTYPALDAEQARAFSYLRGAVERAVAEGALCGDPLRLAHSLWAHTHGVVSLHLAGKLAMGCDLDDLRLARLLGWSAPSHGERTCKSDKPTSGPT